MKKFLTLLLVFALLITQVPILKASDQNKNSKGSVYGGSYTIDDLKKLTGEMDRAGIKKALEDINKNYNYVYSRSNSYNSSDWSDRSDEPDDAKLIYNVTISFIENINYPTVILCSGKSKTIFYACTGDNLKKIVIDNFSGESYDYIWCSYSLGAFVDNIYYFFVQIDGSIPHTSYDEYGEPYSDSVTGGSLCLYKYVNGSLKQIEVDENIINAIEDKYFAMPIKLNNITIDPNKRITTFGKETLTSISNDRSAEYEEKVKKIFSNESIYADSKFLKDVSGNEPDKIAFLASTLYWDYEKPSTVINDEMIASWAVDSFMHDGEGVGAAGTILTSEYKDMVKEFGKKGLDAVFDDYYPRDILDKLTMAFFGKTMNDGDYSFYNEFRVKGDSFICRLPEMDGGAYYGTGIAVSSIESKYNYAIFTVNCLDYGNISSKYVLVERRNVDGKKKLFPVFISRKPFTFDEAENALGYKLQPDFLEGFDKEEALNKNSSSDITSYIDSLLKKNEYTAEIGLREERAEELKEVYESFANKRLSYKISGTIEYNEDLYESYKDALDEVNILAGYLSGLGVELNASGKTVINMSMSPGEMNRYVFSFKDEIEDDTIYNIYLEGLDSYVILNKDDINKLAEKKTVFAISKMGEDLFITPLSKKRTTLPVSLKIRLKEAFDDKYIQNLATLYFINTSNNDIAVYQDHYGPIKFEEYKGEGIEEENIFKKAALMNMVTSKIFGEESIDFAKPLKKVELARAIGFMLRDHEKYDDIELKDIKEEDQDYIKAAVKSGIFKADDGIFNPDEEVNKGELLRALTEVLKLNGFKVEDTELSKAKALSDYEDFKHIAENVELAFELGLLSSDRDSLDAGKVITPDTGMILVYRALLHLSEDSISEDALEEAKPLATSVTNRIKEAKPDEIQNLSSFIFIERDSFMDKLEDLFANKVFLIIFIIVILLIIGLIVFILLKKKKKDNIKDLNKDKVKKHKEKALDKDKHIKEKEVVDRSEEEYQDDADEEYEADDLHDEEEYDDDEEYYVDEEEYCEEDYYEEEDSEIKFCPNCGSEYKGGNFCHKCGYDFRKDK